MLYIFIQLYFSGTFFRFFSCTTSSHTKLFPTVKNFLPHAFFLVLGTHSNVQVARARARVRSNAQNLSSYNMPHFISEQLPSHTFSLPHLCIQFSQGKLGYLVARIAAASAPFAHTNAVKTDLLDPVAPAPFSSFVRGFVISPSILLPPHFHFHLFFHSFLFLYRLNLVQKVSLFFFALT